MDRETLKTVHDEKFLTIDVYKQRAEFLCSIVEFSILKTENRLSLIFNIRLSMVLSPKCDEKEVNRSQLEIYLCQQVSWLLLPKVTNKSRR